MEGEDATANINNNFTVNDAPRSDVNLTDFDEFLPAFHGEDALEDTLDEDDGDGNDESTSIADQMMIEVRQCGLDWLPCWCHLCQLPIDFALHNKKVTFLHHY